MKKHGTTILLMIILALGVCILFYPTFSNWWNSKHQSQAISAYTENVVSLDVTEKEEYIKSANEFNELIKERAGYQFLTDSEMEKYKNILDVSGTGIMAYIEIPSINLTLPVYHGTSDSVLQVAVGHIEWSSLPVGGIGTHCILSGHRGLPSAELFTNLDKMSEGDTFTLNVLGEILTYEVDQIRIVEPEDLAELTVEEDKDLCTLVTCTPYGINSHRLLVRGHRTENEVVSNVVVTADAVLTDEVLVSAVIAAPVLLMLLVAVLVRNRKRR